MVAYEIMYIVRDTFFPITQNTFCFFLLSYRTLIENVFQFALLIVQEYIQNYSYQYYVVAHIN